MSPFGQRVLRIPNLAARGLYVERLREAWLTDRLYMAVSELETDRGYADLALIVRPDMRRFQALDLLLEFKYLPIKQLRLSGEQVRGQSREALAALPAVAAKLDEAEAQVRDYGRSLRERHGLAGLRGFAVVALGVERLVWRAV